MSRAEGMQTVEQTSRVLWGGKATALHEDEHSVS